MTDDFIGDPDGHPVATLKTLMAFLDYGTGDPGLKFRSADNCNIAQLHEGDNSEWWAIHPVDVLNTDGWHDECLLIVTIKLVEGNIVYCFLAVDANGQAVAYHDC